MLVHLNILSCFFPLALKIKKAVTDFTSSLSYDPETRPGVSNLIDIHALLTGSLQEEICEEYAHLDTGR